MSTKLYEAYRFPRSRLDEAILWFNEACQKYVMERIQALSGSQWDIAKMRRETFGKNRKASARYSDEDLKLIYVLAEWMRVSKHGLNDLFNMDCACNLWLRGRWAHLVPYTLSGGKIEYPAWMEFYGYWNNSDPQEGVSAAAWKERGRVWNEMALDDWDRTRLSHIVYEAKMPSLNGLMGLLKVLAKRNRKDDEWYSNIYMAASSRFWTQDEVRKLKKA